MHNNPRQRSFNFKTTCLVIFLGFFLVENGNGQDSSGVSQTLSGIVKNTSDDEMVRCSAAKALGAMGATAKDAVQTLIATVKGTDSNEVRGCAAEALGAIAR